MGGSERRRARDGAHVVTAAAADPVDGVHAALVAAASGVERVKIPKRMIDDITEVIGVRIDAVFEIAKANEGMPLADVDRLFDSDAYEMRMVAVSILDFRARKPGVDRARTALTSNG